jgi:hypothetical protein
MSEFTIEPAVLEDEYELFKAYVLKVPEIAEDEKRFDKDKAFWMKVIRGYIEQHDTFYMHQRIGEFQQLMESKRTKGSAIKANDPFRLFNYYISKPLDMKKITSAKKVKPAANSYLVKVDPNFMEFPYFNFGRGSSDPIEIHKEKICEKTGNKTEMIFKAETSSVMPTEAHDLVLKALFMLYQASGMNPRGIILFTQRQLCKALNWPPDGKNYRTIKEAIKRFQDMFITSKEAFYLYKDKVFLNNLNENTRFNIISVSNFIEGGEDGTGQDELFSSKVILNPYIVDNLKTKNLGYIDWDFYVSLHLSISKRIYEMLQRKKEELKSTNKPLIYKRGIIEFTERIGLSIATPRNIKHALKAALEELVNTGYLLKYDISKDKTSEEKGVESEQIILYYNPQK